MIPFDILTYTYDFENPMYAREGIIKKIVRKFRKHAQR
jgi:hypothetical protein